MPERTWYPYAPDQQFGVQAAADEEALDRLIAMLDARHVGVPRAGNKAPLSGGAPVRTFRSWPFVGGGHDPLAGPCTTATALDAAERVRSDA